MELSGSIKTALARTVHGTAFGRNSEQKRARILWTGSADAELSDSIKTALARTVHGMILGRGSGQKHARILWTGSANAELLIGGFYEKDFTEQKLEIPSWRC